MQFVSLRGGPLHASKHAPGAAGQRDLVWSFLMAVLEQEGIREEVEAVAFKRVLTWQLEQAVQEQQKTKRA
jgi:hypothetical protein